MELCYKLNHKDLLAYDKRIRKKRLTLKLLQREIAEILNVSEETVTSWEIVKYTKIRLTSMTSKYYLEILNRKYCVEAATE